MTKERKIISDIMEKNKNKVREYLGDKYGNMEKDRCSG